MGTSLKQVFSSGRVVLVTIVVTLAMFLAIVWSGNFGLVWQIATSSSVPLADKAKILLALTESITTNFSLVSALSNIAIAVLLGMNAAVIWVIYHSRQAFFPRAESVVGLGGLASGLLGVGCAACGSFVLAPALSFLGAGTLISFLPFGGAEFSLLGVGLLGWSLILSLRKMSQLTTCQFPAETKRQPSKTWNYILSKPTNPMEK